MTKEEVNKAIHFGKPKRVPLKTEDSSPETFKKYGDKLWDLLKRYPSNFLIPVMYMVIQMECQATAVLNRRSEKGVR